jgi:hypothetical protein
VPTDKIQQNIATKVGSLREAIFAKSALPGASRQKQAR